MTKNQILLVQFMEECAEVSQRVSKALRFGLDEIQEGQNLNNRERIAQELDDLIGVYQHLLDEGILPTINLDRIEEKRLKIEKYLEYSMKLQNRENDENGVCRKRFWARRICGQVWGKMFNSKKAS